MNIKLLFKVIAFQRLLDTLHLHVLKSSKNQFAEGSIYLLKKALTVKFTQHQKQV